jgi:hypothetical protein
MTDTAAGYCRLHQHQRVLIRHHFGEQLRGIILVPAPKMSFVRLNEDGVINEKRISNLRLTPVPSKKQD